MRKFLSVVCGFVALVSSFFVIAAIGDIADGATGNASMGVLVGLLVFFATICAGAGTAAVRLWRGPRFDPRSLETRILQLAAGGGGRVTPAEVAVSLKVPIANARLALDALVTDGSAEMLVGDRGDMVYAVNGLLGASDKAAARGVLEGRRD